MKRLYAPWRGTYVTQKNDKQTCIFCFFAQDTHDEKNFILKRFESGMILLNIYPYNAGHILITPYAHQRNITALDSKERIDLIEMTSVSTAVLQTVFTCEGINIGMNIEKASGGSIPEHIHMHVVPRWLGDTNFLTALSNTKAISFDLHEIYTKLKKAFDTM